MSTRRKTIRYLAVAIETEGLTEKEHDRRVTWVEKNLEDAGRKIESAFVQMVLTDDNGDLVGFFGSGQTSSEELLKLVKETVADGGTS